MRKLALILFLVPAVTIIFSTNISAANKGKRIELDPKTTKALLKVIDQSEELRKSLYNKKDSLVQSQISQLKSSVDKSSKVIDGRQTQHILRVLHTINQDLLNAQMAGGEARTKFLESAFKQIVTLYQSYKIEASYKIFFCHIDRAVWLQEAKKPENPFLTNSNCGKVISF